MFLKRNFELYGIEHLKKEKEVCALSMMFWMMETVDCSNAVIASESLSDLIASLRSS